MDYRDRVHLKFWGLDFFAPGPLRFIKLCFTETVFSPAGEHERREILGAMKRVLVLI